MCKAPKIEISIVTLLGMAVHKIGMIALLDYCDQAITRRQNLVIGMVNVAKLVNSRKDPQLYKSVADSDIIAADGQGVVWLSRLIGHPLPERVAGIDVMYGLMQRAAKNKYRIFFLGAKQQVVKAVAEKAEALYPGLQVAGVCDGYFDLEKDGQRVAEQIRASRADILFVAITPPKKEVFMDRWKDVIDVSVCHGVGGSFDVFAGVVKRAPLWMQNCGLEWFYRVLQEPRRMWKRYFVTNSIFLFLSIREICRYRLGFTKIKG
jgi:N-acetylglucosaminyldiphosphoundecaprenol N-acetyl-beta-D-mannosaminyltransferase